MVEELIRQVNTLSLEDLQRRAEQATSSSRQPAF